MKAILFVVALFTVASISSCKKNYTCTCTLIVGGSTSNPSSTFDNVTKSQATSDCNTFASELRQSNTGGGATVSCGI